MSLRSRLILSYTGLVVLCLAIIAGAVSVILQSYRDRFVMARLDDMTRPIYVQVLSLVRGQTTFDELWSNLEEQAEKTGVHILLVDSEGNVIRQANPAVTLRQQRIEFPEGSLPNDFSGPIHGTYKAPNGRTFIFAAYPFGTLRDPNKPANIEALVLSLPRSSPLAIWAGTISPFLWAGLTALVISIVVAILVARSVYKPVQQLTQAAEEIAGGKYDQEIPATGPAEIKGLALAFNQMARQVKLSQQRLRDFVADVSHQLRTPLTSIQGFAQALLDGTAKNKDDQLRAAQVIDGESRRMIRQVNELLELSRMQSGQLQMSSEPVDIAELIRHCQEIFSVRTGEKGLRLRVETGELPTVLGDIDRLEQAICNLLDNAIKHTPAGGEIAINACSMDTSRVEITISDTGQGIPPEQLPRVFERFYQGVDDNSGVGLGLAIAREIVLAHGGDISAASAVGQGTTITISLPTVLTTLC